MIDDSCRAGCARLRLDSDQEGQIVDIFIIIDQEHLLAHELETALVRAQSVDRASGKNILLATPQFS